MFPLKVNHNKVQEVKKGQKLGLQDYELAYNSNDKCLYLYDATAEQFYKIQLIPVETIKE